MVARTQDNLQAEVGRIASRLNVALLGAFRDALSLARVRREEKPATLPAEKLEPLSRQLLARFWTSVQMEHQNGSRAQAERNPRLSAPLVSSLFRHSVIALGREAAPCFLPSFLPGFHPMESTNGAESGARRQEVFFLDSAALDDVALRLKVNGDDGTLAIGGRVTCLYDAAKGIPVGLWYEPDAERGDLAVRKEAVLSLPSGSLLLAETGKFPIDGFDWLDRVGAIGVILEVLDAPEGRSGSRSSPAHSTAGDDDHRPAIEDTDVEMAANGRGRRLRRVSVRRHGRTSHLLTNILDREAFSNELAERLLCVRWGLGRIFSDAAAWVSLRSLDGADSSRVASSAFTAGLLSAALRTAQGWLAEARGLPPCALSPEFVFPQVLAAATADACRWIAPPGNPTQLPHQGKTGGMNGNRLAASPAWSPIQVPEEEPATRPTFKVVSPRPVPRRRPPAPASREEMMAVGKIVLEPAFEPFSAKYAQVGHRDPFLWCWVQRGLDLTALPSIDGPWKSANRTAKLLGVMLDVLLDDVADNEHHKDGAFLAQLLKIPFASGSVASEEFSPERLRYLEFVAEVWAEIQRLAATFPRYAEFADVWRFDYRQLLNTMDYAFLVNRLPQILNLTEHDLYQPHNMHMMISGTEDLMCSSGFDHRDFASIRQALWRGQVMGRIGNMVSTWMREINERDFTSGVFAAAIERGAIDARDLPQMDGPALVEAIQKSGVIPHFLKVWERLRDEVYSLAQRVGSVDLCAYAAGLEELIRNHLGSVGLK